jgi:hypothetical protein
MMGAPTELAAPTNARYVMIQLSGTNSLHMGEVQVFKQA